MKVTQLTHVEPEPPDPPEGQPTSQTLQDLSALRVRIQARREVKEELSERHQRLVQRAKNQKKELRALNKAVRMANLVAKEYMLAGSSWKNLANDLSRQLAEARRALPTARRWWHRLLFWR